MPAIILELLWAGLLFALLLCAAFGYGTAALACLRLPEIHRDERVLFGLGLGLGLLSLLLLLLGVLRLVYPLAAWLLLGLGLALALTIGRRLPASPPPERRALAPDQRLVRLGLALIVGLALAFGLVAHALVPPVDYDVVAYHFAVPKLYIQAHRLIYIPYILHSNWPLGSEMLYMLSLLLHAESAAQLTTWGFAVLLCAAMLSFSAGRLPPLAGWVAAATLFSMQMMIALAGTGMVEVPLACYTFLAFYALWRWRERDEPGWLVLSALLAGCAAATKLNGAVAAIIFAGIALGLRLLAGRPARGLRAFVVYGATSLLVVAPWYLKSWVYTGNPIWPFAYNLLGGRNWDALGSSYLSDYLRSTNMAPTLANWASGLWQVTTADGRFGSFLTGPYMLALLPLGLLPAIFRRGQRPLLAALGLIVVGLYTVWFLMTHQTRFLLPMMPFALLIGAAGAAWIWERSPRPLGWLLQLGLLGWLLAGSWVFDAHDRSLWQRSQPYLMGQIDRDGFLTSVYPDYPAFSYIDRQLPADARVLMAPYEARGYYMDRPYIWANPIVQRSLPLEQLPDAAALRAELQRRGVTHVLMNTRFILDTIPYWDHINGLLNDLVGQHGRLLFESAQSRVYVLDYADTGAAGQGAAP